MSKCGSLVVGSLTTKRRRKLIVSLSAFKFKARVIFRSVCLIQLLLVSFHMCTPLFI